VNKAGLVPFFSMWLWVRIYPGPGDADALCMKEKTASGGRFTMSISGESGWKTKYLGQRNILR
jgi:hypothetical protein